MCRHLQLRQRTSGGLGSLLASHVDLVGDDHGGLVVGHGCLPCHHGGLEASHGSLCVGHGGLDDYRDSLHAGRPRLVVATWEGMLPAMTLGTLTKEGMLLAATPRGGATVAVLQRWKDSPTLWWSSPWMQTKEEATGGRGGPDLLDPAMGSSPKRRDGGRGWAARPPWPWR